ncbi:MAG TPA: 50S ribosomal protein L25 [Patescibacteria group bacterium]|nr:50S ribosomal protein L25 [Patescibacteria group bacterium]
MEALKLEAKKREVKGKKVKKLRTEGQIPAVVYGHGVESKDLAVDYRAFEKLFAKAGESSLVDLAVEGGSPVKVLIHAVQFDPLKGKISHVDFRQVNMKEKLDAEVILKFVGEAPAVKTSGAILVRNMDTITVRCLPGDLVHEIEVDLSKLANLDDRITVADIAPPPGIEFQAQPGELIVVANAPISEEELASLEAKPEADVSAVKVATEEKKAERAAAKEGEAAVEKE